MSDEAKKALEESLVGMLKAAQDGATWAQGQIPLVLQEKLAFDFWLAAIWGVLSVALLLWYFTGLRARIARAEAYGGPPSDAEIALAQLVVGGVLSFMALLGLVFECIPTALKITLAPRLYILEWARELVR